MSSIQLAFIDKLNSELSKVDSFFIKQEAEACARSLRLKEQLEELKDHRRLFHVRIFLLPFSLLKYSKIGCLPGGSP